MGGVPKKRHTKSSRNQRRMHLFLTEPAVGVCPKCGKAVPGHRACAFCGYYKGREIINVLQKLDRKERKKKEKEMRDIEKEGSAQQEKFAKDGKEKNAKDAPQGK